MKRCQEFYLPSLPPSVNALYFNRAKGARGKGRVKTDKYREWIETNGWHLKLQRIQPVPGKAAVYIDATIPKKERDGDNLSKGILDLCVSHQVLKGDSWKFVSCVRVKWVSRDFVGFFEDPACVRVRVISMG
jgi:Holliday junction resolvase RusA-like endonuclease